MLNNLLFWSHDFIAALYLHCRIILTVSINYKFVSVVLKYLFTIPSISRSLNWFTFLFLTAGMDASIEELADYICAVQMAREGDALLGDLESESKVGPLRTIY